MADRSFKTFFALSIAIFLIGGAVGGVLTFQTAESPPEEADARVAIGLLEERPTISGLLVTNLSALLLTLVFPFTLVVLLFNGFQLGHMLGVGILVDHLVLMVALTIPHAIFEMIAMWITGTIGFQIVANIVRYVQGHQDVIVPRETVYRMSRRTLLAILLVFVGALVEVYLTPEIVKLLV